MYGLYHRVEYQDYPKINKKSVIFQSVVSIGKNNSRPTYIMLQEKYETAARSFDR
jgi:hypothetical protein